MPRDKRKRKPRKDSQKRVERYSKAREDCQLNGDIETVPVGAVRDERVDPETQGSQPLPGLVGQAMRAGWATPEHVKIRSVDELARMVEDPEAEDHIKVAAIRALQQGDVIQFERDNPERAAAAKGGVKVGVGVNVTNNNQVNILELARQARDEPDPFEEAATKLAADEAAAKIEEKKDESGSGDEANRATDG